MECNNNQKGRMSLAALLSSSDDVTLETSSITAEKNGSIDTVKREQYHSNRLRSTTKSCKNITTTTLNRRMRNKTASAKYRAKKTTQYIEMQKTIKTLLIQNAMLQSKLKRCENAINNDNSSSSAPYSSITSPSLNNSGLRFYGENSGSGSMNFVLPSSFKFYNIDKYSSAVTIPQHLIPAFPRK